MTFCCTNLQRNVLLAQGVYTCFILALYRFDETKILLLFKLLAVFVHEASHASACWITGGSVKAIEVNLNEGGVTRYVGGWQRVVTPAGYVGGAFWGAAGTILCATRYGQYALVAVLGLALLSVTCSTMFCWKQDHPLTTSGTCLFFLVLLAALVVVDILYWKQAMLYGLLFVTTFISFFSAFDIYDDTIRRTVNTAESQSDAVVCAHLCPICPPKGWGVIWFLMAICFWACGIYFNLYLIKLDKDY